MKSQPETVMVLSEESIKDKTYDSRLKSHAGRGFGCNLRVYYKDIQSTGQEQSPKI